MQIIQICTWRTLFKIGTNQILYKNVLAALYSKPVLTPIYPINLLAAIYTKSVLAENYPNSV